VERDRLGVVLYLPQERVRSQMPTGTFGPVRFVLALAAICAVVAPVALIAMIWAPRPAFDESHPEYQAFAAKFDELRDQIQATRGQASSLSLDLSDLNGGDWTVACLFGGYVNPSQRMKALGAKLNAEDIVRWSKVGRESFPVRLAEVEETEIAIAYIDRTGAAGFIHFRNGIGPAGQHYEQCIARPQIELKLFG
jgi:hypothetical protein